jgi:hypothetical protein
MPKSTRPKGRIRESSLAPVVRKPAPLDADTVGKRLRWAIVRRPAMGKKRGVRAFQRAIEERAGKLEKKGRRLPGITLPSIMTYLNDVTTPSIEFLHEAASVLDVREAWLAFGEGERTEAEQRGRDAAVDSLMTGLAGDSETHAITAGLYSGPAGWLIASPTIAARVVEVFSVFYAADVQRAELFGEPTPSPQESLAEFATLLARPIMRWYRLDRGLDIHPDRVLAIVDGMLHTLAMATPDGRDFNYLFPNPNTTEVTP